MTRPSFFPDWTSAATMARMKLGGGVELFVDISFGSLRIDTVIPNRNRTRRHTRPSGNPQGSRAETNPGVSAGAPLHAESGRNHRAPAPDSAIPHILAATEPLSRQGPAESSCRDALRNAPPTDAARSWLSRRQPNGLCLARKGDAASDRSTCPKAPSLFSAYYIKFHPLCEEFALPE